MARWRDGEPFETTFQMSVGPIDVLAEVAVEGRTLGLHEIAVYPRGSTRSRVPTSELVGHVRSMLVGLAAEGFDVVRITGTRLSGASPGRRIDLTIRLVKEER